jgi:hypothetical protein
VAFCAGSSFPLTTDQSARVGTDRCVVIVLSVPSAAGTIESALADLATLRLPRAKDGSCESRRKTFSDRPKTGEATGMEPDDRPVLLLPSR